MQVIPISFQANDVGNKYKKSKKRYTWRFYIVNQENEKEEHCVMVTFSAFTGTQRIYHHTDLIRYATGQFFSTFNHKFFIDDYKNWAKVKYISFGQRKNTLTLIINNEDFADLYNQQQDITIYNLEKDNKLELYFDEEQLEEIEFGKIDDREDKEFQAYVQKQNIIQKYNPLHNENYKQIQIFDKNQQENQQEIENIKDKNQKKIVQLKEQFKDFEEISGQNQNFIKGNQQVNDKHFSTNLLI